MQILVLLGMHFDAVVVFASQTLLFRLALTIMCLKQFRLFVETMTLFFF